MSGKQLLSHSGQPRARRQHSWLRLVLAALALVLAAAALVLGCAGAGLRWQWAALGCAGPLSALRCHILQGYSCCCRDIAAAAGI